MSDRNDDARSKQCPLLLGILQKKHAVVAKNTCLIWVFAQMTQCTISTDTTRTLSRHHQFSSFHAAAAQRIGAQQQAPQTLVRFIGVFVGCNWRLSLANTCATACRACSVAPCVRQTTTSRVERWRGGVQGVRGRAVTPLSGECLPRAAHRSVATPPHQTEREDLPPSAFRPYLPCGIRETRTMVPWS